MMLVIRLPQALLLTLYQYPETATFLTEEERRFIVQTLEDDSKGQASHLSAKFVWQALADWKTYVQALNSLWYAAPVTNISR